MEEKDNELYVYVEIANIEGGNQSVDKGGSTGRKFKYVMARGKTIIEVRDNLNRQLDKEIYLSTVRTLILTENFAKKYLVEYLFRLRADEFYRKKTLTVITKENPEELFKISNEKDLSVGILIEDMVMNLEETGESFTRTTSRILENLSGKYTGTLLSCIGIRDNQNSLMGYSVVKGDTICGFIPVEDAKGVIYLKAKANKPKVFYTLPYKGANYTIQVSMKKRKIRPTYIDGKINFDIKLDFEAKLMYGDKKTPYGFKDLDDSELSKNLSGVIKKEIRHTLDQAQQDFKTDYLQFDDIFRIHFPEEFEKMDWENEFEKASFNIAVKVDLSQEWMMDYHTNKIK